MNKVIHLSSIVLLQDLSTDGNRVIFRSENIIKGLTVRESLSVFIRDLRVINKSKNPIRSRCVSLINLHYNYLTESGNIKYSRL